MLKAQRSSLLPVGLFTAAYLSIASFFAFDQGNTEFVFYIGVVIAIGVIILLVHRRVNFSPGLLWALSLWGLLHMLGGLVHLPDSWPTDNNNHVLYSWWLIPRYFKYDNPVHAYGFAVATWACWEALKAAVPKLRPTFGILTLCALAGMGLGAANEIIEFLATVMIPGTNVGGFVNTGWDLVANLVGSAVAATIIGLRRT